MKEGEKKGARKGDVNPPTHIHDIHTLFTHKHTHTHKTLTSLRDDINIACMTLVPSEIFILKCAGKNGRGHRRE